MLTRPDGALVRAYCMWLLDIMNLRRRKLRLVGCAVSVMLALAETNIAAHAQGRLGGVVQGGQLRIELSVTVPLSRLRLEIDGVKVKLPLSLQGRTLVVQLPDDLGGQDHDISVFRLQPDADEELGYWTFSTRSNQSEANFVGTLEIENRRGGAGSKTLFNGNGRLGFSLGGGALRGGLGFTQSGTARRGGIQTELSDYFLEAPFALAGQDARVGLGTQGLPAESLLADDQLWRGASFRLSNPDGRSDFLAFSISPDTEGGLSNLTGLSDPDARLSGVAAQVFPFRDGSFKADVLAFSGRADLGDGAGAAQGGGLRFSGPIGAGLGDFALEVAQTETGAAGTVSAASAQAINAELGFGLLPAEHDSSLELRLSTARRDAGFYSPLNPDLISDETRNKAELLYQSDEWQWAFSAERAVSNVGRNAAVPTDAFQTYGLDLTYSPFVFTGGFLQGVTFYGSLYQEDQRRLTTPTGGSDPEDFRLQSLSFGMDRFQPDHAWSLGAKLDWLDDWSGNGQSEQRQRIEAAFAYTPDDLTNLTLRAEHGRKKLSGNWLADSQIELSYAFPIDGDRWSGFVEAGAARVDGNASKNGTYFGAELKLSLAPQTSVLMRADYGQGAEASDLTPGGGWTVGLGLRHEFGAGTP